MIKFIVGIALMVAYPFTLDIAVLVAGCFFVLWNETTDIKKRLYRLEHGDTLQLKLLIAVAKGMGYEIQMGDKDNEQ